MGIDIYFREDLARILASAEAASASTAAASRFGGQGLRAYREGCRAALLVVAQALGLPGLHCETLISRGPPEPEEILGPRRRALEGGRG